MNVKSVLRDIQDIDLLDAQVLLSHVLHLTRAQLYTFDDRELTDDEYQRWQSISKRRIAGEPVAYLVGEKECFGLTFDVTKDVLIPRPDTECLIEVALSILDCKGGTLNILDLGTGSGLIACAIASQYTQSQILATDVSPMALSIAKQNIGKHGLRNIELRQSDVYDHIPETFDLIVSNPPYLSKDDLHLSGEIRFEPWGALVADEGGLAILRRIIEGAVTHLNPGGMICVEHGFEQGAAVREIFIQNLFKEIKTVKDLSGHERVTTAMFSCPPL